MARRRWLVLVALVVLGGFVVGVAWAGGGLRRGGARSLRAVLGPPEPTPTMLEFEADLASAPLGTASTSTPTLIPTAAPEPLEPEPELRRPPDLKGVSFVLLLGADNRSDAVVGRTDAMIVIGFRHRDGKIAAFSLPRDLWVPLPDIGELHEQGRDHARVSSIIRVGEVRLGEGQGLPLLRRVLLDELGVRIDRVASIDFRGFVALVDELGGIEVDVPCPIRDCFWTNGTSEPCVMLDVQPGKVHMDGATALGYVRSRHGTGDHDRTRRQQAVILAFAHKARASGLRGLPGLWRLASPYVETDLAVDDAIYYASFALETELSAIGGFSISHPMTQKHVTEDGKHVMLLDRAVFDQKLAGMFDAELPALRERRHCAAPAI